MGAPPEISKSIHFPFPIEGFLKRSSKGVLPPAKHFLHMVLAVVSKARMGYFHVSFSYNLIDTNINLNYFHLVYVTKIVS